MNAKNSEVLMILPRRTVFKAAPLPENWEIEQSGTHFCLKIGPDAAGRAFWQPGTEFKDLNRPAIFFECLDIPQRRSVFEVLISRLAMEFDRIPGRHSLYIRLDAQDLELIAQGSRMGLIPYFGSWTKSSAQESEASWQKITGQLQKRYPQGLPAVRI